jgi:hypothetical protein
VTLQGFRRRRLGSLELVAIPSSVCAPENVPPAGTQVIRRPHAEEEFVDTRDYVVATLQAHEAELRAAGIRALALFGSTARGDDRPDSDVDLAVLLEPAAHVGLFRFVGLEQRLSDLLGRPVQLLAEPVENARLRANIERDRRRVF